MKSLIAEISGDCLKRLQKISDTHNQSYEHIISTAIVLYDAIISAQKAGDEVVITGSGGVSVIVKVG